MHFVMQVVAPFYIAESDMLNLMCQQIAKEMEEDKSLSVIVGEEADIYGDAPADKPDTDEDDDALDEASREAADKCADMVGKGFF